MNKHMMYSDRYLFVDQNVKFSYAIDGFDDMSLDSVL